MQLYACRLLSAKHGIPFFTTAGITFFCALWFSCPVWLNTFGCKWAKRTVGDGDSEPLSHLGMTFLVILLAASSPLLRTRIAFRA